jgi:hypothetical protein
MKQTVKVNGQGITDAEIKFEVDHTAGPYDPVAHGSITIRREWEGREAGGDLKSCLGTCAPGMNTITVVGDTETFTLSRVAFEQPAAFWSHEGQCTEDNYPFNAGAVTITENDDGGSTAPSSDLSPASKEVAAKLRRSVARDALRASGAPMYGRTDEWGRDRQQESLERLGLDEDVGTIAFGEIPPRDDWAPWRRSE